MIVKLNEINCEELELWKSYFSERRMCIVGVSEVVWKDVKRGCPQGHLRAIYIEPNAGRPIVAAA